MSLARFITALAAQTAAVGALVDLSLLVQPHIDVVVALLGALPGPVLLVFSDEQCPPLTAIARGLSHNLSEIQAVGRADSATLLRVRMAHVRSGSAQAALLTRLAPKIMGLALPVRELLLPWLCGSVLPRTVGSTSLAQLRNLRFIERQCRAGDLRGPRHILEVARLARWFDCASYRFDDSINAEDIAGYDAPRTLRARCGIHLGAPPRRVLAFLQAADVATQLARSATLSTVPCAFAVRQCE